MCDVRCARHNSPLSSTASSASAWNGAGSSTVSDEAPSSSAASSSSASSSAGGSSWGDGGCSRPCSTKLEEDAGARASAIADIGPRWLSCETLALAFGLSVRADLSRWDKGPLCLRSLCWPEGKSPLCDVWDLPLRCDAWDLPVVLSVDFPSCGASLGSAGGFLLMIVVRLPCALPRTPHLAASTRVRSFWEVKRRLPFGDQTEGDARKCTILGEFVKVKRYFRTGSYLNQF